MLRKPREAMFIIIFYTLFFIEITRSLIRDLEKTQLFCYRENNVRSDRLLDFVHNVTPLNMPLFTR